MQKLKLFRLKAVFLLLAVIVSFSCSKDKKIQEDDYTCTTCATSPEAVAANNTINKGIYKGVLIGSSGTLIFNIQNSANTITGSMVIDGDIVALICEVDIVDKNAPFEGSFTGTLKGSAVSIRFRVAKDGTSPKVLSAAIPGHPNAVFIVAKETSDTLLECYEGTYTISDDVAPEKGTYNFLIARKNGAGTWWGIAAENGFPEDFAYGKGNISGNDLVDANRNGQGKDIVIATISGQTISGNFVDRDDEESYTVTHNGKRTF